MRPLQHGRRLADAAGAVHHGDPGSVVEQRVQGGEGLGTAAERGVRGREHARWGRLGWIGREEAAVDGLGLLAGLDAELVAERAVKVLVGGQRVGSAAGAVEHGHEPHPQALAQGVEANQLAQVGGQLVEVGSVGRGVGRGVGCGRAGAGQGDVGGTFDGLEGGLQQTRAVVGDQQVRVDGLEGEASPVPQGVTEEAVLLGGFLRRVAPGEHGLETVQVHCLGRDVEGVAAGSGADGVGARRRAQPGHQHLDRLAGVGGAVRAPDRGRDALGGHGVPDVEGEYRQEGAQAGAEGEGRAVDRDDERAEQAHRQRTGALRARHVRSLA